MSFHSFQGQNTRLSAFAALASSHSNRPNLVGIIGADRAIKMLDRSMFGLDDLPLLPEMDSTSDKKLVPLALYNVEGALALALNEKEGLLLQDDPRGSFAIVDAHPGHVLTHLYTNKQIERIQCDTVVSIDCGKAKFGLWEYDGGLALATSENEGVLIRDFSINVMSDSPKVGHIFDKQCCRWAISGWKRVKGKKVVVFSPAPVVQAPVAQSTTEPAVVQDPALPEYRLLKQGEVLQAGDEFRLGIRWQLMVKWLGSAINPPTHSAFPEGFYRRKTKWTKHAFQPRPTIDLSEFRALEVGEKLQTDDVVVFKYTNTYDLVKAGNQGGVIQPSEGIAYPVGYYFRKIGVETVKPKRIVKHETTGAEINLDDDYRMLKVGERVQDGDVYLINPERTTYALTKGGHNGVIGPADGITWREGGYFRKIGVQTKPTQEDGYRFLNTGETIKQGDQYFKTPQNEWRNCQGSVGHQVQSDDSHRYAQGWYRRKLTDPGTGYRLLKAGEVTETGDQYRERDGRWTDIIYAMRMLPSYVGSYRRKLPAPVPVSHVVPLRCEVETSKSGKCTIETVRTTAGGTEKSYNVSLQGLNERQLQVLAAVSGSTNTQDKPARTWDTRGGAVLNDIFHAAQRLPEARYDYASDGKFHYGPYTVEQNAKITEL